MSTVRDAIRDELYSCVKRGLPLPARPLPRTLWNALGGDGPLALLVMLEFVSAEQEVTLEQQKTRTRERLVLAA